MNPRAYRLISDDLTILQSQNLTVIARVVQRSAQQVPFEPHEPMAQINLVIQRNMGNMSRFVDAVSTPPSIKPPEIFPDMTIESELASLHNMLNKHYPEIKKLNPDSVITLQLFDVIESLNTLANYELVTEYPEVNQSLN